MENTPLGCYRRGNVAGVHRKNKWGFVRKIHQETQVIRNTGSFLKITERHIFADTKNQKHILHTAHHIDDDSFF